MHVRLSLLMLACQLFCTPLSIAQNQALYLSGAGEYLSVENTPSLASLSEFTIEALLMFEPGGTENPRIFSKGWEANGGLEFGFLGTGDSRRLFAGSRPIVTGSGTLQANRWYHVAVSYGSGTGFFAVDGTIDSSFSANFRTTNNFPVNFGRNSGNGNDHFRGYLDELRLWNRKLSLAELRSRMFSSLTGDEVGLAGYWNFESKSGKDLSPFANHGSLAQGATILGAALTLDPKLSIYPAVEIELQGPPGKMIQLQVSTNLQDWSDFGAPIPGMGLPSTQFLSARSRAALFYRIKP